MPVGTDSRPDGGGCSAATPFTRSPSPTWPPSGHWDWPPSSTCGPSGNLPAPAGDLSERYLWYLEVGRKPLVDALDLLGEPDSYPLVFHCAAGKDRTGVLAALVLDILGVDPGVIVADYVIAAGRMELIMEALRK
jgi:hypothetical protein